MADSSSAIALTFHETRFDLVENAAGEPWLRSRQIAGALGYAQPDAITDLYNSNAAEFTINMTALVKLPTAGGAQEVRIFSLRGAHLLGMFARTDRAAEFRRWVLDVLDSQPPAPAAVPVPHLVGQTFERVVAERDALRAMMAERVLREEPHLRRVIYYYNLAGLTHKEKALLMGWKSGDPWMQALRKLAALGLIDYTPDPRRQELGRANMLKLRAKLDSDKPIKPPTPPSKMRPTAGHAPEHMARIRKFRKCSKEAQS